MSDQTERRVIEAAKEWHASGADVVSPDGRAHRAIRELRRAVVALAAGEPEAPPEPDPWPRRIWLKVDLHDAPLGPYEVDEWQHYTLNGEDHHHPVIVGQDGRIHLPLPAALWEPITEPAPEATTPGDER